MHKLLFPILPAGWRATLRDTTEREQSVFRIVIESLLLIYFAVAYGRDGSYSAFEQSILMINLGFLASSIWLLAQTYQTAIKPSMRYTLAAIRDVFGISLTLYLTYQGRIANDIA